jgi:3-hydroxy-9,10-secoandrosta-1,3,5(10)-triene-9,17-dione monooxygenase
MMTSAEATTLAAGTGLESAKEAIPTEADLVERARALLPMLRERAAQTHEQGNVPVETMDALKRAGLFRIVRPKRYGGYEMHPAALYEVQMVLAEACMSTAWVQGLLAVHDFQLALFDDRAQAEVWGSNPDALVSSTYQPVGKVDRIDGGYRLSGHWRFSSGAQHADWIFLGSIVQPETADARPDLLTFLLPRSDYKVIEGSWKVFGLQGTGSLDIVVEDAFIPEYRTHSMTDGFEIDNQKGLLVNTAPLFRLPWGQLFARIVSSAQIGSLKGAHDAFVEIASKRVSRADGTVMAESVSAMRTAARVASDIAEMRGTLRSSFDAMLHHAETSGMIPMDERLRYRYEAGTIARRCARAVDSMMEILGTAGIDSASPVLPFWRDIMASRAHFANNPDNIEGSAGGHILGRPSMERFC